MLDLKKSRFFDKLPAHIRESIMQSGVDFKTEEDLRQFVSNLKKPEKQT